MRDWLPDHLPEDVDAERSFLATCGAPGAGPQATEAVASLVESDFIHPAHRAVFKALRVCHADGLEVSSLTLKTCLEQAKELHKVGGYPGLVELLAGEDVERPQVLADVLLRKSKLRKMVHIGAALVRGAANEEDTPEALLDAASGSLADLTQPARGKGFKFLSEVGGQALERVVEVAAGRREPGVLTGMPSLDRMTGGGFKPGQLVVLAARPGVGKSTLAMKWAKKCAQLLATSAFFSLEMTSEEVWTRLCANESGISSDKLALGQLGKSEWEKIYQAKDALAEIPMLIEDQAEISVPEMRARIDRATAKFGRIGLVLVDYLQLVSSAKGSAGSRQNEAVRIGEISRGLKLLAKDRNLPLVVLSQLNREVEHRQGGRPQLSDLRDSGAIEQDADVVLFLHRKGTADSPEGFSYELIIAKNRNGPTGLIHLAADLSTYSFKEMVRETEAPHSNRQEKREAWL